MVNLMERYCIACMDFKFIGGSMGSVVGEKISLCNRLCNKKNALLLLFQNLEELE